MGLGHGGSSRSIKAFMNSGQTVFWLPQWPNPVDGQVVPIIPRLSVDSPAPAFTLDSRTYSHKSDDTITRAFMDTLMFWHGVHHHSHFSQNAEPSGIQEELCELCTFLSFYYSSVFSTIVLDILITFIPPTTYSWIKDFLTNWTQSVGPPLSACTKNAKHWVKWPRTMTLQEARQVHFPSIINVQGVARA